MIGKKRKIVFICVFALITLVPLICAFLHIEVSVQLTNTAAEQRPPFSLTSFLKREYQTNFEAYWNSAFPNHNLVIKVYNQLRYSLFGEGASPYIRGNNDYIQDQNFYMSKR